MMMAKDILAQSSMSVRPRSRAPARRVSAPSRAWATNRFATELRCCPLIPSNWGPTETATSVLVTVSRLLSPSFVMRLHLVVNGGRRIVPTFLSHPADREARSSNRKPVSRCASCCATTCN
jgi:hypothetical protein